MTPEQAKALREPFPPEQIGKLPKAGMQLDYVGHAAVTDRLIHVDPSWTWEPVATDPNTGAPLIVNGGLWIRLTVCGVTRYGFGDGPDPKQLISDAIRNAAMRFGVALDLWSRQPLEGEGGERVPPPPPVSPASLVRSQIKALADERGLDVAAVASDFAAVSGGVSISDADEHVLTAYLERMRTGVAA